MENVPGLSSRDKIKIIIITAIALFVSAVGISYAYFAIQITGNDTASSMRLTSANMQLIYTDVQIVSGDDIEPGWTETKTLTVQNVGNVTSYYTIIWRDLLNEITNDELVISATCVSTSGSCPNIAEKVIPTTTPEGHNINVKKNISIPVGVTHTYTVTIEFIETGSNQNYNQDKIFNGTLNIAEGKEPLQIVRSGTDSTTGLPVVTIGTEEFYVLNDIIDYSSLISTNGNIYNYSSGKSVLLAKYNLYVGQNCTSSSSCTPISTSATGYGLQSADAKGYVDSSTPRVAVVPFSGSSTTNGYWYDSANSTIYSKYGTYTNYANNIYDTAYNTAPNYSIAFYNNTGNANYSIAYYVEEYVNRLGIDGEGRLLTRTEAIAMTKVQRKNGAYYWLGSADDDSGVWNVYDSGILNYRSFYDVCDHGVRPVIVVDAADIKTVPIRAGTDSDTGLPKVTIGSETFLDLTNAINYTNLINTNGNIYNYASDKSVLLAKYNLYVGQTCTSSSSCTPISTSATGYGLQSADAKGYVDSSTPRVAVVPFSGSSTTNGYWYDSANSTIYSKYGTYTNYANNVYDTTYSTAPNYSVAFTNNAGNANYSIAYYVEEYINRLGIEGTGRLLTYTEANAMTQVQRTNGAHYWLGSAGDSYDVWAVRPGGDWTSAYFGNTGSNANYRGVRPVIVVNTSDIQSS